MDMTAVGATRSLASLGTPAQLGLGDLTQGSSAGQTRALIANAVPQVAIPAPTGVAGTQSPADSATDPLGNGSRSVQALMASLGGSSTFALPPSVGNQPVAVRYAYDQSQNPDSLVKASASTAPQIPQNGSLNLLA